VLELWWNRLSHQRLWNQTHKENTKGGEGVIGQEWLMSEIEYFGTPDIHRAQVKKILDYVCEVAFSDREHRWWNDYTPIHYDADDAMCFMTDFIEENPNNNITIMCANDAVFIRLKCGENSYIVSDYIDEDAHNKVFEMLVWVMAQSLGFKEE